MRTLWSDLSRNPILTSSLHRPAHGASCLDRDTEEFVIFLRVELTLRPSVIRSCSSIEARRAVARAC